MQAEKRIDELLREARGVTIDSRTAMPGEVFFAIRGEAFDGNRFAAAALEKGCVAAVVENETWAHEDERYIVVPDGLKALQQAAHRYRMSWSFPVIALTGSNGKTTTKELMRDVLASTFKVSATVGNFNNEIGVPLTLLRMPADLDFAIVEMGANAQGEIRQLVEIARPDFALITNIGQAHLEGFGGIDGVKKGKSEIYSRMRTDGTGHVFVNAKHGVLEEISEGLSRTLYGTEEALPAVRRRGGQWNAFEWQDATEPGTWRGPVPCALEGDHNLENVATAFAVGRHFGVPAEAAEQAIANYRPTNNRSEWRNTERNQIFLDAYNANPSSMLATLAYFGEAIATREGWSRALIVLGEMGELGEHSATGHEAVTRAAAELGEDLPGEVVLVGKAYVQALQAVATPTNVMCFPDAEAASAWIAQTRPSDCIILLKGSRSASLETLLPLL